MLDDLYAGALADAGARRDALPFAAVEAAALDRAPALDARAALAPAAGVKIIAEVKRASPSRGDLHAIPDPASLALSYATGGASASSSACRSGSAGPGARAGPQCSSWGRCPDARSTTRLTPSARRWVRGPAGVTVGVETPAGPDPVIP